MIISNLISSQLPSYISNNSEYSNFVNFLEVYYEWLETESVLRDSIDPLNLIDIDNSIDSFVEHFYTQYIPEIPKHIYSDKRKLLRFIREFYRTKGTPKSYKFLFRALFDSYCQITETEDFVLKTSSGTWFNPISLKIKNTDLRFLNTDKFFILGEKSNTFAKIEIVKLINEKIEIFLAETKLLFDVTEFVKIVDSRKMDVLFDQNGNESFYGDVLRSQFYRPISNLTINPKFRGNYYAEKNPVVIYGGLDDVENPKGAKAEVGSVNTGYITKVEVDPNSCLYGYRKPETEIRVFPDNKKHTIIEIDEVDYTETINLDFSIISTFEGVADTPLAQIYAIRDQDSAKAGKVEYIDFPGGVQNTKIKDFQKETIVTGKLKSVIVENGGGGFSKQPELTADGMYVTAKEYADPSSPDYDPRYDIDRNNNLTTGISRKYKPIGDFGILAPLKIISGGLKYTINDTIEIDNKSNIGGSAYARIKSVNANGVITEVEFYQKTDDFNMPGGMGYQKKYLDKIKIVVEPKNPVYSTNAKLTKDLDIIELTDINDTEVVKDLLITGAGIPVNTFITNVLGTTLTLSKKITETGSAVPVAIYAAGANIVVSGILGSSAKLIPYTERIGSINSFKITDYGEDYVEVPKISLKIEDILVTGISDPALILPQTELVNIQKKYSSYFHSIEKIFPFSEPTKDIYLLRLYDYNKSLFNVSKNTFVTNIIYFSRLVTLTGENDSAEVTLFGDQFVLSQIKAANIIVYGNSFYTISTSTYNDINNTAAATLNQKLDSKLENVEVAVHFPITLIRLDTIKEKYDVIDYDTHLINNGVHYDLNYERDMKRYNAGIITYGDGTAKANCKFLNGIIVGDGRYLDGRGHISSYNVLQDDNNNSFSYVLSVEVELMKFKKILKELLHPAGTKVITQVNSVSNPYTIPTKLDIGYYEEYTPQMLIGVLSAEKDNSAEGITSITIKGTAIINTDYITIDEGEINKISGISLVNLNISGPGVDEDTKISRTEIERYKIYINTKINERDLSGVNFTISGVRNQPLTGDYSKAEFLYLDDSIEVICTKTNNKTLTVSKDDVNKVKINVSGLRGANVFVEPIIIHGSMTAGSSVFNVTGASSSALKKVKSGQYIKSVYSVDGTKLLESGKVLSVGELKITLDNSAIFDINTENKYIMPVGISLLPEGVTVKDVNGYVLTLSDEIECDNNLEHKFYFDNNSYKTIITDNIT